MAVSQFLVPNQIFLRKKHFVAKKWNWENCLHVLSLPNSGNSYDFGSGPCPRSDRQKKLLTMGWMQLGHVCVYPCMSQTLLATNERSFNMLLRVWMLEEKHWTAQRQLETLFIHVAASQPSYETTLRCKGVELGELSASSKLSKGPCMDLSLHVPNSYLEVVFN